MPSPGGMVDGATRLQPVAPRLVVMTNVASVGRDALLRRLNACCAAARPGTVLVVLRDPELPIRDRVTLGRELRRLTTDTGQRFSVRDRLDIAELLDADGVHLAESSIDGERIRRRVARPWLLSRAWHSLDTAPPRDVDFVLLSPVCATRKTRSAIGLEALALFSATHPAARVCALGGVDASNAASCLQHGAAAVAVMGAVLDVEDCSPLLESLEIRRNT
ncbi:MAG: thiamine phosphate synthase [Polyangiaceae bacterium]